MCSLPRVTFEFWSIGIEGFKGSDDLLLETEDVLFETLAHGRGFHLDLRVSDYYTCIYEMLKRLSILDQHVTSMGQQTPLVEGR